MAKLILTNESVTVKEFPIKKERITIGRKSHNDIQLDDNTVSGEHAILIALHNVYIEDLGSTNGTLLNGKRVKKRMLSNGDVVRIGRHDLKFVDEQQDFEATVMIPASSMQQATADSKQKAVVKVLSGPKSGDTIQLTKLYTTLGAPGVQVAVIAKRGPDYYLVPMGGGGRQQSPPILNNQPLGAQSQPLKEGDVIEVAGSRLQFTFNG